VHFYVLAGRLKLMRYGEDHGGSRSREVSVKVTLVAWQYGRGAEPAIKTAEPVEQTFFVTKERRDRSVPQGRLVIRVCFSRFLRHVLRAQNAAHVESPNGALKIEFVLLNNGARRRYKIQYTGKAARARVAAGVGAGIQRPLRDDQYHDGFARD